MVIASFAEFCSVSHYLCKFLVENKIFFIEIFHFQKFGPNKNLEHS